MHDDAAEKVILALATTLDWKGSALKSPVQWEAWAEGYDFLVVEREEEAGGGRQGPNPYGWLLVVNNAARTERWSSPCRSAEHAKVCCERIALTGDVSEIERLRDDYFAYCLSLPLVKGHPQGQTNGEV